MQNGRVSQAQLFYRPLGAIPSCGCTAPQNETRRLTRTPQPLPPMHEAWLLNLRSNQRNTRREYSTEAPMTGFFLVVTPDGATMQFMLSWFPLEAQPTPRVVRESLAAMSVHAPLQKNSYRMRRGKVDHGHRDNCSTIASTLSRCGLKQNGWRHVQGGGLN